MLPVAFRQPPPLPPAEATEGAAPVEISSNQPIKIAVVLFGLSRLPSLTIESIRANIFACNSGSEYRLYTIASLNVPDTISNPRSGELDIHFDMKNLDILGADFYGVRRQNDADILDVLKHARKQPDQFGDSGISMYNLLHQLLSLQRAWDLANNVLGGGFKYFLFVRPDTIIGDKVPIEDYIEAFEGPGNIALPPWQSHRGFNDRIAFADAMAAEHYARRIALVPEYCKNHPLHSESLLSYALRRGGCRVWSLPVRVRRVRANGVVVEEDFASTVLPLPAPPNVRNPS
jgi:hypothetical protein